MKNFRENNNPRRGRMSSMFELFVGLSAMLGVAAGTVLQGAPFASLFPVALFFMLWPVMLDVRLGAVRSLLTELRILAIPLALNFIVSPVLSFWLARLFLADEARPAIAGMLLFGMMPSGGMVPAYTAMVKGNRELSLAVMTISLLLSIAMVPLWTAILLGKAVAVPPALAAATMAITIVLPLLFARTLRALIVRIKGKERFNEMKAAFKRIPGWGLLLMVFSAFALNGNSILRNPLLLLKIAGLAAVFLMILFVCSSALSRRAGLCRADSVAVAISSTAKNNAISMSLAALFFSPATMLTIAIAGSLVQLPLMLGVTRLLNYPQAGTAETQANEICNH